jgi:hypothetical protein
LVSSVYVLHAGSLPGGKFAIHVLYNMQLIVEMCSLMTLSIAKTKASGTVNEYAVLMKDYGENRVLREKLVQVSYYPPQIPNRLALE